MARTKDWRVIIITPSGSPLPPTIYASREAALRGGLWHAKAHRDAVVKVQRYDYPSTRWVLYTQTTVAA